jgi:F-type H+-transporting ATPase subunit a
MKGSAVMDNLGETLMEELNCETVFTIGNIDISEAVVVTWIIMAFVVVVSILLTRNLKVEHPGRGQLMLEQAVTWVQGIGEGIVGEEGKRYAPYLTSVLIYLGIANLIGILGFKPPTKDMNVTAAMAIMSIFLIEFAGIRKKGLKKWLKDFTEPVLLVTPINILEIFIKPLSLCMRLFGNVLGAFVIMKLIECILPVGLPIVFSLYFDLFDGLIQAYVFVFLTGLFIKEAME